MRWVLKIFLLLEVDVPEKLNVLRILSVLNLRLSVLEKIDIANKNIS